MKKNIRIKTGTIQMDEYGQCKNLHDALVFLKNLGLTEDDFKLVTIENDYSNCYYEGDTPDLCLAWPDIY